MRIAQCLLPGVLLAITLSAQEPPAAPPPPPPLPEIFAPGDLLLSTDTGHCYASGLILGTPVAKDFAGGHVVLTAVDHQRTIEVTREDGRFMSEPFPEGTTPRGR